MIGQISNPRSRLSHLTTDSQFMIAGSTAAGSIEHMAMFPVDTLKTCMQAITTGSGPFRARPIRIRKVLVKILRSEGHSGLYGVPPPMGLGAGPAYAVYFSVYELCKRAMTSNRFNLKNNHTTHAVSGIVATVWLLCPKSLKVKSKLLVWAVSLRLRQICNEFDRENDSVVKRDGCGELKSGWVPRMLSHAPAAGPLMKLPYPS